MELSQEIQKQLDGIIKEAESKFGAFSKAEQDTLANEFINLFAERLPMALTLLAAQVLSEVLYRRLFKQKEDIGGNDERIK